MPINIDTIIESVTSPTKFLGDCYRIRLRGGEEWWQHVMGNKVDISLDEFIGNVNPQAILDDDETFESYLADNPQFNSFYKMDNIYVMADGDPNGFEYFWEV